MDIKFAIPSYKRPDKMITLQTLQRLGIDKSNVYVFLQNKEDWENYHKNGVEKYSSNIVYLGAFGMGDIRYKMCNYFEYNEPIVFMDDDIGGFSFLNKYKKLTEFTNKNFYPFIKYGFKMASKEKSDIWGLYPIKNEFYMDYTYTTIGMIIGVFYAVFNKRIKPDPKMLAKSDLDLTCRSIRSCGKALRFNNVCYHHNKSFIGGVHSKEFEYKRNFKVFHNYLLKTYPEILKENPNPKRKNEVLIKVRGETKKLK